MLVQYLNPFIESVYSLCSTMLACSVERGQPGVRSELPHDGDITAIIGLSGPARGTVALSFPIGTAQAMVGRLLQMDEAESKENVADGVAELVNIVAGSAKAKFPSGNGQDIISLGLPTVINGGSEIVQYPKATSWLDVPFQSELGPFFLRVTFEHSNQQGVKAA